MLYDFIISNRDELIRRCKSEAAMRYTSPEMPAAIDHGVPLFLQQLADTLLFEQSSLNREVAKLDPAQSASSIGRAAALHGAELLRLGFSINQVVHGYGDVCQSVMDLAIKEKTDISSDEFRTLNRCLDSAIADAVTSYGLARQVLDNDDAASLRARLDTLSEEHRRLVNVAIQAYSAIRAGHVGVTGATSNLLMHALDELRYIAEQTIPDISSVEH